MANGRGTRGSGMRHLSPRLLVGIGLATALAGCSEPLDFDLRDSFGASPSTTEAARSATAARPEPDARGIISYPGYQVAVARPGDTLARLAARIGANTDRLARYNGMQPGDNLRPGEIIALPARVAEPEGGPIRAESDIATLADDAITRADGGREIETSDLDAAPRTGAQPVRHKVERGETAYSIARLYDVPVRTLAEWNSLGPDFTVREGQFLLIPVSQDVDDSQPEGRETAAVTPPGSGSPAPEPPSAERPLPEEETRPAAEKPEPVAAPDLGDTEQGDARMIRPLEGPIIRDYDKGRNEGIDIAGDPGAEVRAAAEGRVVAVTEDPDGRPIAVIRHADGLLTVYSSLGSLDVANGDTVTRGQVIGALPTEGTTALHFEVRDGIESLDPNPMLGN